MHLEYIESFAGALLMLLFLADVFLTVLYARVGTGIISVVVARMLWRIFRGMSRPFRHRRGSILSFCGPVILVTLVLLWAIGLTLGTALIIHPRLGKSVVSSSGSTPTDFITAMYAGGSSLSIVGAGNFSPKTGGTRMFYLLNSLVGMSVISLTLTYLMQVYSALHKRNELGLKLHLLTAQTGDAAQFIAGLGPQGDFDSANSTLMELGSQITSVKEAHHFYPVLFYFRFSEPFYSVSLITLTALDTAALLRSALDANRHGSLQQSAALTQIDRASRLLLTTLEEEFLVRGAPTPDRRVLKNVRVGEAGTFLPSMCCFQPVFKSSSQDRMEWNTTSACVRSGTPTSKRWHPRCSTISLRSIRHAVRLCRISPRLPFEDPGWLVEALWPSAAQSMCVNVAL